MNESILNSLKALLGLAEDYTPFDAEIIMHINSFFDVLYQLGVGSKGFEIADSTATWADFIGSTKWIPSIKTWMYLRVRQVWDPPNSGVLMSNIDEKINELTWRIVTEVEYED